MSTRWCQIGLLWLIGILAAAQLAKIAVLAPQLSRTFNLSLPQVGLLISLLEVGGALGGLGAGLLIGRIGARRFLVAGLVLLALTGSIGALTADVRTLFIARAGEGIGYVLAVIAAPTLIAGLASERDRGAALALWSTFVPLGVAIGSGVTGWGVSWLGTTGILLLWAASFAVVFPFAARLPLTNGRTSRALALPRVATWLSTASFGVYTMLVCALTALLPIFLVDQLRASVVIASTTTAFVSAAALPGCLAMILIMRRGLPKARRSVALAAPALMASAAVAGLVFGDGGPLLPSVTTTGQLAILTVLLSGLVPPLLFARLPALSGAEGGDDPKLAVAQGLLTQFGAAGALVGPPFGGIIVGVGGWPALGMSIAALTVAMLAIFASAELLEMRETMRARQ